MSYYQRQFYSDREYGNYQDKQEEKVLTLEEEKKIKESMYLHRLYEDIEGIEKYLEEKGYISNRENFKGTAEEYLKYIKEINNVSFKHEEYERMKIFRDTPLRPKNKDIL